MKKVPERAATPASVVSRVRASFYFLISLLSRKGSPMRKDAARVDTDRAFFKPPETASKYKEK